MNFYKGFLESFKKCWSLRAFKHYGKSGDLDQATAASEPQNLQSVVWNFSLKDVFICNKLEMFWQVAPDKTNSAASFAAEKEQK